MELLLRDIAKLQPGVYINSSEYNQQSQTYYLSLRDFDEDYCFLNEAVSVNPETVKPKYFVEKNDVLFSIRVKFHSFFLPFDEGDKYVASNSFVIISPDEKVVLPKYLHWFLNHFDTQKTLEQMIYGHNRVSYINIRKLGNLVINLPDLEKQRLIIDCDNLFRKQKDLTNRLIQKKEFYTQTLLMKSVIDKK